MDNQLRVDTKMVSDCSLVNNYDWDTRIAFAVCMAESRGVSTAVGDDYPINGLHARSCGLFQLRTLEGRPSCEELFDPNTNMDWAYKISGNGSNFKPWTMYTNGEYMKYL